MKRSNWPFFGAVLLLFAVGGTILLTQRGANSVLRMELAVAREQNAELDRLRREGERLREGQLSPEALAKLRSEHAALERLRTEIAARMAELQKPPALAAGDPLPEGMIAMEELSDAGRETPRAAAVSFLRSRNLSDVDALANSTCLDGESRHKVEEVWNNLPEESRAKYPTPEHLVALLHAVTNPVRGIEIINESKLGGDVVSVRVRMQFEDGKIRSQPFDFRRTGDGWLLSTSPAVIDKMLPLITGLAQKNAGPAPK